MTQGVSEAAAILRLRIKYARNVCLLNGTSRSLTENSRNQMPVRAPKRCETRLKMIAMPYESEGNIVRKNPKLHSPTNTRNLHRL